MYACAVEKRTKNDNHGTCRSHQRGRQKFKGVDRPRKEERNMSETPTRNALHTLYSSSLLDQINFF